MLITSVKAIGNLDLLQQSRLIGICNLLALLLSDMIKECSERREYPRNFEQHQRQEKSLNTRLMCKFLCLNAWPEFMSILLELFF
jgi:hypothetical protein